MALKTEEREIGGLKYRVTQLGAKAGRAALLRIMKTVGPAAAMLQGDDLAGALGKFFENLSEVDLDYFCALFGEKSFVFQADGKMPRVDQVFDEHFAGRYLDMIEWLIFAGEVNFADFFRGVGGKIGGVLSVGKPPAPTPSA
jgi:hypothetical protein